MLEENQREIFRNNLLRLLRQRGKSQMEVAEAVGVSPQTFNTWCQGKAYPRIEKLTELANYFGIFTFELMEEEKPKEDERVKRLAKYASLLSEEYFKKLEERAEELVELSKLKGEDK